MTGELTDVGLAAFFFLATHFYFSRRKIRTRMIRSMGIGGFTAFFSVIALAALTWLVMAYAAAPFEELWPEPKWGRPTLWGLMACALALICDGFSLKSPTGIAAETKPPPDELPKGAFAVTRHPVMWGTLLWAAGHLAVNGDVASVIMFGAFVFLAFFGMIHMDRRRRAEGDAGWTKLAAQTSFLPFWALLRGRRKWAEAEFGWARLVIAFLIFVILLLFHETLTGKFPGLWLM